jgi:hypothetical protein
MIAGAAPPGCGRGRIRFPTRAESAKKAGLFPIVEALDYQ